VCTTGTAVPTGSLGDTTFPQALTIEADANCTYNDVLSGSLYTGSATCKSATHHFGIATAADTWGFQPTWTGATDEFAGVAGPQACEHWPIPAATTQIHNASHQDITGTTLTLDISGGSPSVPIHDSAFINNFSENV